MYFNVRGSKSFCSKTAANFEMDKKYLIIGCHVLWRELCHYTSISRRTFNFRFLEQGLHNTPDLLRKELQQAIDEAGEAYEAILVGYGLCSKGIEGIKARRIPLVFMRGHDCITFFLGSRHRYRDYFRDHPGTYWYTPGWIEISLQPGKERYEATLRMYIEKYGEDNAEYLMEMEQNWFREYNNAAYVDLGFMDGTPYKEYTRECARWLNWQYDELEGDPSLMADFVEGKWDTDRFLIVEPGQRVMAAETDEIIRAV